MVALLVADSVTGEKRAEAEGALWVPDRKLRITVADID